MSSKITFLIVACLALLPVGIRYTIAPSLSRSDAEIGKQVAQLSQDYTTAVGDGIAASAESVRDFVVHYLSVEEVSVAGNSVVGEDELLSLLSDVPGDWFWNVDSSDLQHRLMRNPWVSEALIEKHGVPVKVSVNIKEKKPSAIVELDGRSWIVSETGSSIQQLSDVDNVDFIDQALQLPRLSGFDQLKSDSNFSFSVSFSYALKFLEGVEAAGGMPFVVDRYELERDGTIIAIPEPGKNLPRVFFAILDSDDSVEELLSRLRIVLKDLDNRQQYAQELDLRFKNQAIIR